MRRVLVLLAVLGACAPPSEAPIDGGTDAALPRVDSGLEPAPETTLSHTFPAFDLAAGEELLSFCQAWTLGNEEPIASIPGEIVPLVSDWYDFAAKYDEGGMELVIPPRLDEPTIARVQELAVAAFVASDCEGMARVDFFVREDGEVLVNEPNTIPGFTATSVYAKLFEASGIPYEELLDRLVSLALERHDRRARLKY